VAAIRDEHEECQFWAAWSAVLLGDRGAALDALTQHGLQPARHRERAFRLAFQAMTMKAAHTALQWLAADEKNLRWVIHGSVIAGDPAFVPCLIKQMPGPKHSRLAGEAFTSITGADLGADALDRPAPEAFEAGPTDDPDDPNVDADPDDGMSWPDLERVQTWWDRNASRFQAGARHFIGEPISRGRAMHVLKNGYQRQRVLAAHYVCLLEPGTPLFNTSAPALRQQTLLAEMA
jgi:uncharacterized protein (TIGR02270 family)